MQRKPIAHLICGYIGSGKSTFARKLQAETGAMRITKDEWLIRLIGNDPNIENFEHYDDVITTLSYEIAFDILKAGVDVIIDDGLWVKSDREKIRSKVLKLGAEPRFYYTKCSMDTMKRRIAERNPDKGTFIVTQELFVSYLKFFDEFGPDENYIVINTEK